jgi:hypothetical protein
MRPLIVAAVLLVDLAPADVAVALSDGCRDGVTPFCADPQWPTNADAPPVPLRHLDARVAPAPPVAGVPAGE